MKTLRLRLPPLTCLLVFEAAARHRHFTKAASELGVTQSAVSRQINQLEEHLGRPLFERTSKGSVLTEAGEILSERLRNSFESIAQAIHDLRKLESERPVVLSASTNFCHFWIVPRLSELVETYPQIRLRLEPHDPPLKLNEALFDVGIFYGKGAWTGTDATRFLNESVFPVASPRFASQIADASQLDRLPLLQYESFSDESWMRWETWFEIYGGRFDPKNVQMSFRNYADLIDAVLAGRGLALGWAQLLDEKLACGALVRVGSTVHVPVEHYYVVTPSSHPMSRAATLVAEWFLNLKSVCLDAKAFCAPANANSSPNTTFGGPPLSSA
jgi:DNA-binding transcriptional LysR family regulator